MIDTVPSEVILTPVLDSENVKHVEITLNVDWSGKLTLAGFIRYIEAAGSNFAPDMSPSLFETATLLPTRESGPGGLAVFGERFLLQDTPFVVPALSSIIPGLASFKILDPAKVWTFNVTAAYLTTSPPPSLTATIAYRVPQPGNMSPRIDKSTTMQLNLIGKAEPFSLCSVMLEHTLDGTQVFSSSMDIVDEGSSAKAEFRKHLRALDFA
ncbi:hypothetical protein N7G274_004885 [Stereocaulon virgatum]|uniref:Uncharacterized protein n=1 Tax=Stereocaulon virgatum TaxID=373712 RepID=A0ABR4ACG5_9LECA